MLEGKLKTEDKIFQAALNVFFLYGYYGTTLHRIAIDAGVQKSAVHYYFRTKDKLYTKVVVHVIENILKTNLTKNFKHRSLEEERWFFAIEMHNNQTFFLKILHKYYPNDWEEKLKKMKLIFKIEMEVVKS